jgi:hypothetical protein
VVVPKYTFIPASIILIYTPVSETRQLSVWLNDRDLITVIGRNSFYYVAQTVKGPNPVPKESVSESRTAEM